MCFSATASFTAGAALLIVGTVTTRRAARRAELPFALIPVLFGIQQLIEGALWLTFPAKAPVLNTVLTHVYSLFSHVLWPVYVPVAVLLIEPTPWRRKVLATIAVAGAAVALYLLYFLVRLPIVSQVTGRHIAYISPHFYAVASMALYLLGTCVSLLFSSHLWVRVFGVAAFLSFIAVYVSYATWFISVWCFFAALLSGVVLLHFRRRGARGHGNPRYFRDQAFHFQTLRALNNIRTDGADTAEVLATIGNIREGDVQSWHRAWEATADRVLERAGRIGDARSRGQALLRAHNYLRTAEFFLPPSDPKRPAGFRRNVEAFDAGLDALGVERERMRVPYGPNQLNAIFYPGPAGAQSRPLLVLCGGFDSTLEELYFVLVPAAHERAFSVLTFEGPGQGAVLREQKLVFTPEWERPTSAVLDAHFALHPRRTRTVLIGMSMGGYLAPRAAAFDRRIDGVVAFDVLYDFGEIARRSVPRFAMWLHAHHADAVLNALIAIKARFSPGFAWSVANSRWVLGSASAIETIEILGSYTLAPVAGRIEADVLILAGAEDHFIPARQAADFARALTAARSVRSIVYDRASGGAEHCQMGAQSLWQADFFDWIARIDSASGGDAVPDRVS